MKKITNWMNEQTTESVLSYIFGFIAFCIALDGFFFLPLKATRYGASNEGIITAFLILMFTMILIHSHQIKKLKKALLNGEEDNGR